MSSAGQDDTFWLHLLSWHGPVAAIQWDSSYARQWHETDHRLQADPASAGRDDLGLDYVPHPLPDLSWDAARAQAVLRKWLDFVHPLDPR